MRKLKQKGKLTMNKEEIQAELKRARAAETTIKNNIIELLEQLVEAENPKLGHGDFGIDTDNGSHPFIVMEQSTLYGTPKAFYENQMGLINADKALSSDLRLGNIFDLLEKWGEDLEEREVAGIRISVRNNCIFVGEYRLSTPEKQELFWKTIAQEYFTLKRKENKCS